MTRIIAWTGHRPQDLGGMRYLEFAAQLNSRIPDYDDFVKSVEFVTGGALGIDTWATEWAYVRDVPYHIILPFFPDTQMRNWQQSSRDTLTRHLKHAASITTIGGDRYEVQRYQERNMAMVDKASEVWTWWSGKNYGGTWNCIQYALKMQKSVFNIRNGHFIA